MHALHCFSLPMRINRELRLYLGFEASETLSPQHGSCHMRRCSQPTWHLFNSTPAKDTYLLPPIMVPPSLQHRSLLLSYTSEHNLVIMFFLFHYVIPQLQLQQVIVWSIKVNWYFSVDEMSKWNFCSLSDLCDSEKIQSEIRRSQSEQKYISK